MGVVSSSLASLAAIALGKGLTIPPITTIDLQNWFDSDLTHHLWKTLVNLKNISEKLQDLDLEKERMKCRRVIVTGLGDQVRTPTIGQVLWYSLYFFPPQQIVFACKISFWRAWIH